MATWTIGVTTLYSVLSTVLLFVSIYYVPAMPHWWDTPPITGLGGLYSWIVLDGGGAIFGLDQMEIWGERWIYLGVMTTLAIAFPLIIAFLFRPFCRRAIVEQALAREAKFINAEQGSGGDP